jgi:hypothetical protein
MNPWCKTPNTNYFLALAYRLAVSLYISLPSFNGFLSENKSDIFFISLDFVEAQEICFACWEVRCSVVLKYHQVFRDYKNHYLSSRWHSVWRVPLWQLSTSGIRTRNSATEQSLTRGHLNSRTISCILHKLNKSRAFTSVIVLVMLHPHLSSLHTTLTLTETGFTARLFTFRPNICETRRSLTNKFTSVTRMKHRWWFYEWKYVDKSALRTRYFIGSTA